MLESLHIEGFRRFKDFTLNGFDKINFILGENNVGKTSVLEAVYTWACGQNFPPLVGFPLSRGRYANIQNPFWVMEELLSTVNDRHKLPLQMTFEGVYDGRNEQFVHIIRPSNLLMDYDASYKNDTTKNFMRPYGSIQDQGQGIASAGFPMQTTLIGEWEIRHNNENESAKAALTVPFMNYSSTQPMQLAKFVDLLSHVFIAENVQMYANLKREGLLEEVAKEMNKAFPQIKGFDMIPYPDGSQAPISVENQDGSYLPMYAYGDGVQKWFYILGVLTKHKNSIICIDEVDTGFHPAAQASFCISMIQTAIKNNVQLFLTTHNIEFVDNLLNCMVADYPQIAESINIITMRNTAEGLRTRNLNAKEASRARDVYNMELR